jgi:hypothetical protein
MLRGAQQDKNKNNRSILAPVLLYSMQVSILCVSSFLLAQATRKSLASSLLLFFLNKEKQKNKVEYFSPLIFTRFATTKKNPTSAAKDSFVFFYLSSY